MISSGFLFFDVDSEGGENSQRLDSERGVSIIGESSITTFGSSLDVSSCESYDSESYDGVLSKFSFEDSGTELSSGSA